MTAPTLLDDSAPWERFYGFGARPFSLTPDLRFAFHSRSHSQALQQLTDALRRREGIIVVTGEVGTGKTMLCRTMLETFERRTFVSAILDPGLGVDDLLNHILQDFGLVPHAEPGTFARPAATRHQMVTMLQRFLATLVPLNAHAVVIMDEAQQVEPPVLEQLRLLTNFETDSAKLLQVVLVGQPNLDDLLARAEMKQVAQRVARRIQLYPLSDIEVQRYVERRLVVASETGTSLAGFAESAEHPVEFTDGALRLIAELTQGIPRVVNTVCDRALEIAYQRRTFEVDQAIVQAAAERLMLPTKGNAPSPAAPPESPRGLVGSRGMDRHRLMYVGAAAIGALAVSISWWSSFGRQKNTVRSAAPAASAVAPAPSIPSPAPADRAATPSAVAPKLAAPSHSPATGLAGADAVRLYIAVAAFRTQDRASAIARQLSSEGLTSEVRAAAGGAWQQVVVGPFASVDEAAAAQKTLTRLGFDATRVFR
jgi:general secretion pathway protein A